MVDNKKILYVRHEIPAQNKLRERKKKTVEHKDHQLHQ